MPDITARFSIVFAAMLAPAAIAYPALAAGGGWSSDPAVNLAVAEGPGDQIMAKVVEGANGDYVSWYDNGDGGGYDLRLQHLDAQGRETWPHNGYLVADTSFSSVTDYDMAVGADGHALIAFRDDRQGGEPQVTVASLSTGAQPLWGWEGLQLSQSSEFVGPPKVVGTTDGQVVVAWSEGAVLKLHCLALDGQPVWAEDLEIADSAGAANSLADLHAAPNGGVIVSWVRATGFSSPKHLYAQRFSRDGQPMWGLTDGTGNRQALAIFDTGSLQFGDFPPFLADPDGGAVFGWYETSPLLQVRVQHVRPDGSLLFPAGGALTAEPDSQVERVEPALAYDATSADIYAFWRETPSAGGVFRQALLGQRFGPDGNRRWGNHGREIVPYGPNELVELDAQVHAGRIALAYVETLAAARDQRVWLRKLDKDGADQWSPAQLAMSSAPTTKSRLALAEDRRHFALLSWHDNRAGNEDVFLQNVNADGMLGQPEGSATPPPADTPRPTETWRRRSIYLPILRRPPAAEPAGGFQALSVAPSLQHTCAVDTDHAVWCWGLNLGGSLGTGIPDNELVSSRPLAVAGLGGPAVAVTSGAFHSCAVLASGAAKCWGSNQFGELGNGIAVPPPPDADSPYESAPVDVVGLDHGVLSIVASRHGTCALVQPGAVKCWGLPDYRNPFASFSSPIDMLGLESGVVAISSGLLHTCALLATGSVRCWGLFDDQHRGSAVPEPVPGLDTGVRAISSGVFHDCALMATGTVKCWGANDFGQLGDGSTVDSLHPVTVTGLPSDVAGISAGGSYNCAWTVSGQVLCWGYNVAGQLGLSPTDLEPHPQPEPVRGLAGPVSSVVTSMADRNAGMACPDGGPCAGPESLGHTCAILAGGRLQCWGGNGFGQLGDGTLTSRLTPGDVLPPSVLSDTVSRL